MDPSGSFVVAWRTYDFLEPDVRAQRFDPAGAAIGTEFRIDTSTSTLTSAPAVSGDRYGNFVVAWQRPDTIDAQRFATTGVGDLIFSDLDEDGIQDPGEPGVLGVPVHLFDGLGGLVRSTASLPGGGYSFSAVPPGDHYVQFELPADWDFSPADVGGDDAVDSDAEPSNGETATFALALGTTASTWDAGLILQALFADGFETGDTSSWSATIP